MNLHAVPLLVLFLTTTLSGCLGSETTDLPVATPTATIAWSWTEHAFAWSDKIQGDAAARIVTRGTGTYDCALSFAHTPSATLAGWDMMIFVQGGSVGSWVVTGSAWHDARVYAGPLDSGDIVAPHQDDGRYPIEWPLEGLRGEVQILVVALGLASEGDAPNLELEVRCPRGSVASVALGAEAATFGAASGTSGAGANAHALVVAPAVSVASGGVLATPAQEVWLAVAGYKDSLAVVTVEGDGSEFSARYVPEPSMFLEDGPASFTEVLQVGAAGTYTYGATEGSLFGLHAALVGVTPLRMPAV